MAGEAMSGIGGMMTLLITIPALLVIFGLLKGC